MPSLMDLPEELLEQIVLDVADQDRLALYRDVVYVSKGLNRIASPHVARHSPIRCMNPYAPPTPTHVLLLHLFQHPEQAKNVRTLIADSDEGCKIHPRDWRAYCESFTGREGFGRIADVAKETCPALASSSD
ncbi:hypothetical protein FIE12Z_791 [Fusarium flagelliforme]|uniref:F-box domain-containing protein n=1 Tax=Fusarium flagelliforme TaxID=2675880 RepID=A0A395N491_9HYPO|nr:hypothetical protein FIE12Z_791 [Fusarium flagelliforme]